MTQPAVDMTDNGADTHRHRPVLCCPLQRYPPRVVGVHAIAIWLAESCTFLGKRCEAELGFHFPWNNTNILQPQMLIFTRTACQLHIGSRWRKKGGVRRETDQKQDSDLNMIDSGLLDCCLFYLLHFLILVDLTKPFAWETDLFYNYILLFPVLCNLCLFKVIFSFKIQVDFLKKT